MTPGPSVLASDRLLNSKADSEYSRLTPASMAVATAINDVSCCRCVKVVCLSIAGSSKGDNITAVFGRRKQQTLCEACTVRTSLDRGAYIPLWIETTPLWWCDWREPESSPRTLPSFRHVSPLLVFDRPSVCHSLIPNTLLPTLVRFSSFLRGFQLAPLTSTSKSTFLLLHTSLSALRATATTLFGGGDDQLD